MLTLQPNKSVPDRGQKGGTTKKGGRVHMLAMVINNISAFLAKNVLGMCICVVTSDAPSHRPKIQFPNTYIYLF